jgi:DNA invertase Pin-like site-specific DNA recombinase
MIAFSYIRFSTPEQALGDSERRQLDAAENWAKSKELTLDSTHTDRGRSGFKGTNRKKGALGDFLKKIAAREIPRGSYLVVEDLDRLSREHPFDSIGLIKKILSAGVIITVLKNESYWEEYSEESIREDLSGMKMMGLVFELGRASGESARKSRLGTKNWAEKRKHARTEQRAMTQVSPAWIKTVIIGEGRNKLRRYEIDHKRAPIVLDIFKWHSAGEGVRAITKRLNDGKVETWGRGKSKATHWHQSYILKILSNPSVMGYYQPHKFETIVDPENPEERKQIRVPTGDPIPKYYPKIPGLELDMFQAVQAKVEGRRLTGGRIGDQISNLFPGGLVVGMLPDPSATLPATDEPRPAPTVQVPCRYKNGGAPPKSGIYLVADVTATNKARTKEDEVSPERWSYSDVEYAVLKTLEEINWAAVAGEGRTPEQTALAAVAAGLDATANELRFKCDNLANSIADTPLPTTIKLLAKHEGELAAAEADAASARKKLNAMETARTGLITPLDIQSAAYDPTNRAVRLALRAELSRRIQEIRLTPKTKIPRPDSKGRIAQIFRFQIGIFFVNGVSRFIRVTANKGTTPTIAAVAFLESLNNAIPPSHDPEVDFDSGF